MTEARCQFWRKWLTWVNVVAIGLGLLVAFASNAIFFAAHNTATEEVFSPDSGFYQKS